MDLVDRPADELAEDLPLHLVILVPARVGGSLRRRKMLFAFEPRSAGLAIAGTHRMGCAVEPKTVGMIAGHDFAKHGPEILLGHARVKAHAPAQRLSLGIDANPLRMVRGDPAVVAQVEVDAEPVAAASRHVAPHAQHIAGHLGRRVADLGWIGSPARVALGVHLDHVRLAECDQPGGFVHAGIASDFLVAKDVVVFVEKEQAILIPVGGRR